MLIAGEVSGDALGGRLMAALRERWDGDVRFTGVGGEQMAAEGLLSLFPMSELSVMGLAEVLPRLPGLLRRIVEVASFAREAQPDVLVTIDAPSFGLRVARRLGGAGIPLVHYVAPQLWAWRPSRARRIARTVDRLLALLPFEPEFFARYGVPCSFVGHPVVELPYETPEDGVAFREEFGIPADAETLLVLPGSRQSETARLLPVFGGTIKRLAVARPELQVIVATLPSVEDDVRAAVASWPLPVHLVTRRQHRFGAFATADVALAASGTVSLELALARVPTVIAYRTGRLTAAVVRRLIRVSHIALPNILAGRTVMPEFVQENCTPETLSDALGALLKDAGAREAQRAALAEIGRQLGADGPAPSLRAADAVLEVVERSRSSQLRV